MISGTTSGVSSIASRRTSCVVASVGGLPPAGWSGRVASPPSGRTSDSIVGSRTWPSRCWPSRHYGEEVPRGASTPLLFVHWEGLLSPGLGGGGRRFGDCPDWCATTG